MRSLRLALCTGAMAAAAFAPAAYAADGGVLVTPGSPTPGSDIRLRVPACTGKSGTAASEAFVADARLSGKSGALSGTTRVRSTLDPGRYRVRVTCDGVEDKVTGTVTVLGEKQRDQQEKDRREKDERPKDERGSDEQAGERRQNEQPQRPESRPESRPEARDADGPVPPAVPASPVAPVQAGGGGSAELAAAESRSEGPGTRHAVVGFVLAGIAAVAVAVSSARRGRGCTD